MQLDTASFESYKSHLKSKFFSNEIHYKDTKDTNHFPYDFYMNHSPVILTIMMAPIVHESNALGEPSLDTKHNTWAYS